MNSLSINDLEVFGYIGTFEEERKLGQIFKVNLEIKLENYFSEIGNDLSKTVDYSKLLEFIREYFQNNNGYLLESFGDNITREIFKNFNNIREIDLEIFKPACHVSIGFKGMSVKISRKVHKVYISLGSNLGDREGNLSSAVNLLKESNVRVKALSSIIETEPYGDVVQDKFLNQVIEVETILYPRELMDLLLGIEHILKRKRDIRWGPRTIDLDILLYDNDIINEENVIIPHYDMHNRYFVLSPLCEINKFAYHSRLNKYAYELLSRVDK